MITTGEKKRNKWMHVGESGAILLQGQNGTSQFSYRNFYYFFMKILGGKDLVMIYFGFEIE